MLRIILFLPVMLAFDLFIFVKFITMAFVMPFSDDEYAKEEVRQQWAGWKQELRKHYIGF